MADSAVNPMAAFYAAVTAVEEGKVAEVECEFTSRFELAEGGVSEDRLVLTVRRRVKHWAAPPVDGAQEAE